MDTRKINQSETVEINRSQASFSSYNPRKKSDEVIASIKRNFKKVGYLGGIVWNELSGNIVSGHKRLETLDIIYKYDGTPKTDYVLKVEKVSMDPKTEKEQNIYMNNKAVQGDFDYKILAGMTKDIDIANTGLTEFDINKMSVFVPDMEIELPAEKPKKKATPEEIENLKELKKKIKNDFYDDHDNASKAHLTLVFEDYANKVAFMEMMELDIEQKMISGEAFAEKVNMFE